MQVMINRFKDAQLETNQPIEFESDQVQFKLLNSSDGLWIVKVMNSSVVSVLSLKSQHIVLIIQCHNYVATL